MTIVLILLFMLFAHVVDDYYLQGILAKLKQKSWWQENAPQEKYKHDYIVALIIHSFSWAFMIMSPCLFYLNFKLNFTFIFLLLWNIVCHAYTDHCKANHRSINLVCDQLIHFYQILITWLNIII